jgi:hypothetical protein
MKYLITIVLIGIFLIDIQPQTRRIVLLEEATNASCAPCAANNPGLQQFLSRNFGGIIAVKYHAWWPGADPMYSHNTADNSARINYYGINGVPNYTIDGKLYGVPNDQEAMESQMYERLNLKSPVKILITPNITNDSVRATIKLIGLQPVNLTNLKLRIAVTERLVVYATPPGSNGEKTFPDVMRKMLPDANGYTVTTLNPGDTITYNISTPVITPWVWNELAVVAWLQSDATKEIVQSNISLPTYISETQDKLAEFLSPGETYIKNMSIANDNSSTLHIRVKNFLAVVPATWSYSLLYNNTAYDSIDFTIPPGDTAYFQLKIVTGSNPGSIKLKFIAKNLDDLRGYGSGFGYFGAIKNGRIILIDDDGGAISDTYFKAAFDSIGADFTSLEAAYINAMGAEILSSNIKIIFWSIGWGFPAVVENDIAFLKNFLNGGGRLFISGQDIGWDIFDATGGSNFPEAMDFYNNYLGATYINDNAGINSMEGVTGTMGDGLAFPIVPVSGAFYPEEISAFNTNAVLFLKYTGSAKYGGIHFSNSTFKTIYIGVGLEQINSVTARRTIIERALTFMDYQVPVELSSFSGSVDKDGILLNWSTASELNNKGFEVERSIDGVLFNHIGFVKGSGTSSDVHSYQFKDQLDPEGINTLYYRLKQVDYNGQFEYSSIVTINIDLPLEFNLNQNYPNPFNPSTIISFALPVDSKVIIKIFDITGQEIITLLNEDKKAGRHEIDFNSDGLSSGIYFYKINAGDFSAIKKMTLIK